MILGNFQELTSFNLQSLKDKHVRNRLAQEYISAVQVEEAESITCCIFSQTGIDLLPQDQLDLNIPDDGNLLLLLDQKNRLLVMIERSKSIEIMCIDQIEFDLFKLIIDFGNYCVFRKLNAELSAYCVLCFTSIFLKERDRLASLMNEPEPMIKVAFSEMINQFSRIFNHLNAEEKQKQSKN